MWFKFVKAKGYAKHEQLILVHTFLTEYKRIHKAILNGSFIQSFSLNSVILAILWCDNEFMKKRKDELKRLCIGSSFFTYFKLKLLGA